MYTINTIKLNGIDPVPVTVEIIVSDGIGIHLVGLADSQVKESLLRTVTGVQSKGYGIPGKKTVINLSPADLRKEGTGHDLAIALSLMAASGKILLPDMDKWLVLGEVALDGSVRPVPGSLQAVLELKNNRDKYIGCILPEGSPEELLTLAWENQPVYLVKDIQEAADIIRNPASVKPAPETRPVKAAPAKDEFDAQKLWNILSVSNTGALRAAEIAAAGGHNLILVGAPGSGKCSVAKVLWALLPKPDEKTLLTVAKIYSSLWSDCRLPKNGIPFRAPHYSCSGPAFAGGGAGQIIPGEVTLAHGGVLLLDEFNMFPRGMREILRAALEDKKMTISRLKSKIEFPADFQLVATTLPCPCGNYSEGDRCTCTEGSRLAFLSRIDGPVYDHITMQQFTHKPMLSNVCAGDAAFTESFDEAKKRVEAARERQKERYASETYKVNDRIPASDILRYCWISEQSEEEEFLGNIMQHLGLSARAYSRILRIARTIADLDGEENVKTVHIAEAASYRFLDRRNQF